MEKGILGNDTIKEYEPGTAYPVRTVTPKGEETTYRYDRVGRRMSIGNAYGTVELSYNSRNLVTRRTDGEGHASHRFYDRMGRLTAYYPPVQWEKKEGAHEYRYDFMARLVDAITPLEGHRRVFRNAAGDITRRIHPVSYALHGEEGEGTRYEYDSDGNCIRTIHPDGGVERRFHDADGNMVKQILPESYDAAADDGAGYRYAYDPCGRLAMVQDPEGNLLHTYGYDGHGQVIREMGGEGKETLYAYNGIGLKTREQTSIRREGDTAYYRVASYAYDSQGNKVEEAYGQQEVEEGGEPESWHRIAFSYDQNNRLVLVEDGFGAQMRYDYDCLGNVILEEKAVEEGIRSTVRYAYNRNGWRIGKTEEIQGNGEVKAAATRYEYDANGSLVKQTTPKGSEISWGYDADGRLVEERATDRRNGIDRRVQYAYDEAGRILKRTVLGADGERLESGFGYDLKDRLACRTTPGGASVRYLYDRNDRVAKEVGAYCTETEGPDGMGATYAYDSRGNRIRIVNALGETVQELSYNLNNQVEERKDAYGNRTGFIYGLDGQLAEVRREDGRMEGDAADHGFALVRRVLQQYEYGANGQITGIIDGNRNRKEYGRDSWGRITAVRHADGTEEGYWYTPAGKISRTVDGNGNSVQYRYNSLGKVRERIDQMGYKETFLYDEEGNLALHVDRDGRRLQRRCNIFGRPVYEKAVDAEGKNPCISTWHYDSLGRLVRAVGDGHSYEYAYDGCGNLKEKRSSGRLLAAYAYDRAGQIRQVTDQAGTCTCYEYDIMGRRSRVHNGDGLDVRYSYDALDRIRSIRYGNGVETRYGYDGDGNVSLLETRAGEEVLLSFAYQYDGNGNRTAKTGSQARAAVPGSMTEGSSALDISYRYDVRGRLLEERRNGTCVHYAYDRAGNRVRKEDASGETAYHYNGKNQMISAEGKDGRRCFTYDRQGGILEEEAPSGTCSYSYDSRHRQARVEERPSTGGKAWKVQENRYDAENLRFELLENGRCTSFVYHNGELLHEERRGEGQTSFCLGAGMDAFQRGQEVYYIHQDEQLGTALVTDREGGVSNSYRYDAFGNGLESLERVPNRICYTGQQFDELTGQYYLRARYYNPALGRFMQEDVYQGDGLNLYAYCGNNPVVYYDPSGYDDQQELLKDLPNKTYDERINALYERRDEAFQQKIDNGSLHYSNQDLLPGELDAVLGRDAKANDNMSPHHMPSAYSIDKNENIDRRSGACSNMMTDTHKDTFTYGLNGRLSPYDMELYNSLSYEDRILFDQYDLQGVYAETRPNVDMDVVEYKLQEEYELAMGVKNASNQTMLESGGDVEASDKMQEETC